MKWIYLSPHLDDAVYSCGGRIREQTRNGDSVEIWTLFTADPPEGPLTPIADLFHMLWQTDRDAFAIRREEDQAACQIIGAIPVHFPFHDIIYRRNPATNEPLVHSMEEISSPISAVDQTLLQEIVAEIKSHLPGDAHLACPLSLGNHRDHRLTRAAVETLGKPTHYFADYPYAEEIHNLQEWIKPEWQPETKPIPEEGIKAWQAAVAAYASQLSSFWVTEEEMYAAIAAHAGTLPGHTTWFGHP